MAETDVGPQRIVTRWDVVAANRCLITHNDGYQDIIRQNCCNHCDLVLHRYPEIAQAMNEWVPQTKADEAAARARACNLLLSLLSPEQQNQLEQAGYFTFRGQSSKIYMIRMGYSGNVSGPTRSYCCYVNDYRLPTYDHMIAQYLALRYNEEHFLATAL